LKHEVGTLPRFFYYFDEDYPRADTRVPLPHTIDTGVRPGGAG
jgi:hypothetical protein